MPRNDSSFSPTPTEVNRARMQGTGVGQREMDEQRDPTRAYSAEQYGDVPEEERSVAQEDLNPPRDPKRPEGADQYDFEGDDNPQEDGGDPAGAAQMGRDHTRRPERTEAMMGQGPKTRAANKAQINREPGFGPKGG